MRAIGNPQWPDTYPSADIISNDIDKASGFVIVDEGMITGYFAFLRSPEPTYSTIYNGEWMEAGGIIPLNLDSWITEEGEVKYEGKMRRYSSYVIASTSSEYFSRILAGPPVYPTPSPTPKKK